MSVKKQLLQARQLIEAKKYQEAYALLRTIDHPKAKEWMSKIEPRLRRTKSDATQPKKGNRSAKAKKGGINPMVLGIGVLLIIVLIAGLAFTVPNLLNNDAAPVQTEETTSEAVASETEQVASNEATDEQMEEVSSNDTTESMTEGDDEMVEEDEPEAVAQSVISIVGSGQRMVMFERFDTMLTAELPEGWVCDCAIGSIDLASAESPRQSLDVEVAQRAFDPDYFLDKTIEDAVTERLRDDETLISQETIQVGEREVVKVVIADEDGDESIDYLSKDSDGHVVAVIIQSWIDGKEELDEAALFIAGNVEGIIGGEAEEQYTLVSENAFGQDAATGRWYLTDLVNPEQQLSVEMPGEWVIEGVAIGIPMATLPDSWETSATALVYLADSISSDQPLQVTVTDFITNRGESFELIEIVEVNGREVMITVEIDPEGDNALTTNFYTVDSGGDLLVGIVQSFVPDVDSIRNDVLSIMGSIEAEEVTWEDRLRQAGLLGES